VGDEKDLSVSSCAVTNILEPRLERLTTFRTHATYIHPMMKHKNTKIGWVGNSCKKEPPRSDSMQTSSSSTMSNAHDEHQEGHDGFMVLNFVWFLAIQWHPVSHRRK
jgi:hypothetical protein